MNFSEERFPVDISIGSAGGPGFRTDIVTTDSGAEVRVSRWSRPRHQYDVAYGIKSVALFAVLKAFYVARAGAAYGFRYKDFMDFTSNADGNTAPTNLDQAIGVGNGMQTLFQLQKSYTSGAGTVVRPITKPVAATTLVAKDGVNQTSGWSVNTTSGIITFTTAPANGVVVAAGFEFDVPVRFDKSVDDVMKFGWDDYNTVSAQSIQLVEILDPVRVDSALYYGGAEQITLTANYQLAVSNARVVEFTPTSGGYVVKLPDLTADVPFGGPLFVLVNVNSGAYSITLQDFAGSAVATIGANSAVTIWVATTDGTTKAWLPL